MLQRISILPATDSDIPDLASLRGGGNRLEQTMLGYLHGTYSPGFAEKDRAVFVARLSGEFAGYVAGHRTTRFGCDGELQWLNVAEKHRGIGVADALIQKILDWFRSKEINRVCVNVDPANHIARRVYERHGAAELDQYWLIWSDLRVTELQSAE